jgi:hypothetical protein
MEEEEDEEEEGKLWLNPVSVVMAKMSHIKSEGERAKIENVSPARSLARSLTRSREAYTL